MVSDRPPVALVTGGSAGLGFVIARKFLGAGYSVVIVGRDSGRLDDARGRLDPERCLSRTDGTGQRLICSSCDIDSNFIYRAFYYKREETQLTVVPKKCQAEKKKVLTFLDFLQVRP